MRAATAGTLPNCASAGVPDADGNRNSKTEGEAAAFPLRFISFSDRQDIASADGQNGPAPAYSASANRAMAAGIEAMTSEATTLYSLPCAAAAMRPARPKR